MVFRFLCALALFVAVTAIGIWIERQNLDWNRVVSRQHYQREIFEENIARLKTEVEELGAPARILEQLNPKVVEDEKGDVK